MAGKGSTVGFSQLYPKADLGNPHQFEQVVRNIHVVHGVIPEALRAEGKVWYDKVNEAVAKGVKGTGTSEWHGAGIVAAVSPSMDWEGRNIHALTELHGMKARDWATIAQSAATGGHRTGEARSVLQGLSIAGAADRDLMKAHRMMMGEDPDVVLNRRTAPKTNSFAHNIYRPDIPGHVTIDYRAHDIAINKMYPTLYSGRGISSAGLPSGKPTRYEHFENAYRAAAEGLGEEGHEYLPHQLQAVNWVGGKHIETLGGTRQKGVTRKGQAYVSL